jgi:hypothetical protein
VTQWIYRAQTDFFGVVVKVNDLPAQWHIPNEIVYDDMVEPNDATLMPRECQLVRLK